MAVVVIVVAVTAAEDIAFGTMIVLAFAAFAVPVAPVGVVVVETVYAGGPHLMAARDGG